MKTGSHPIASHRHRRRQSMNRPERNQSHLCEIQVFWESKDTARSGFQQITKCTAYFPFSMVELLSGDQNSVNNTLTFPWLPKHDLKSVWCVNSKCFFTCWFSSDNMGALHYYILPLNNASEDSNSHTTLRRVLKTGQSMRDFLRMKH